MNERPPIAEVGVSTAFSHVSCRQAPYDGKTCASALTSSLRASPLDGRQPTFAFQQNRSGRWSRRQMAPSLEHYLSTPKLMNRRIQPVVTCTTFRRVPSREFGL